MVSGRSIVGGDAVHLILAVFSQIGLSTNIAALPSQGRLRHRHLRHLSHAHSSVMGTNADNPSGKAFVFKFPRLRKMHIDVARNLTVSSCHTARYHSAWILDYTVCLLGSDALQGTFASSCSHRQVGG